MGGYLEFTSGKVGDMGDFSLAGDQALMDALGMSITRQSTNNIVEVSIEDASGNVRTSKTSSDNVNGLLKGVDLKFDSTPAQVAGHGGIVEGLKFANPETLSFNFDVGGTAVTVNVTLSGNYSLEGIAAEINKEIAAVSPNTGMSASVVDGQIRLDYSPTNGDSSTAINITSGSDVLGFVAGSYTGFVDGNKDVSKSIRGISLLDSVGSVARDITLGDGVANRTFSLGSTVTAGADLLEINEIIRSVNNTLVGAGINVRMDEHNGSIAFTSTILGRKNNNGSTTAGIVQVSSNGGINDILGYKDGTSRGSGDTNYRVHVVASSPSYQIGANEGQQMKVSISNMSAEALWIDKLDMSSVEGAQKALGKIDIALSRISGERSKLGAYTNRLTSTMSNLDNTATNLTDAESRIRDVDMASELINFTSSQIKEQVATAMLAQANSIGQNVLSLLR